MSIDEYAEDLEQAAREALFRVGALKACPVHSDVTIRVGDEDFERHAYALATTIIKRGDEMWKREDLMDAIKHELDMAADGACPACEAIRDT